jgi:hypothetical protein
MTQDYFRQGRHPRSFIQSPQPIRNRVQQARRVDPAKAFRIKREISKRASQHGPRSSQVPISMMVERHGHLDQSLQKPLLGLGGGAPDIFERLVRVEKGGAVEQFDPLLASFEIHATLWHNPARPDPSANTEFHIPSRHPYPLFNIKAGT